MTLLMIKNPQAKWTEREASYVEKTVSRKEKDKLRHLHSLCSSTKIPVTLEYNFIIQHRSICQLMCCPFHAILNPSSVTVTAAACGWETISMSNSNHPHTVIRS